MSINTLNDFSVNIAHSMINSMPAINPVSLIANGIPTMPAPMIALTRLDVAPAIVLLCSCAVGGGSFFIRRDVPPGVDTWISLRGVEGAKNGDLSIALLGAIVIIMLLLFALN